MVGNTKQKAILLNNFGALFDTKVDFREFLGKDRLDTGPETKYIRDFPDGHNKTMLVS